MEYINSVWQIGIIALVCGALIGALAYRLLAPSVKQADKVKNELEASKEEMVSFKASVNEHFDKTSELVNDLTQNYVKVYQHLAEGAQTLGDNRKFTNLLENHEGRVSIAVDGDDTVPDGSAEESSLETSETREASTGPAADYAVDSVDLNTGEADTAAAADNFAKFEDAEAANEADKSDEVAETLEPVLNVEALDEVADKVETEAAPAAAENKEKPEARTTH